MCGIAGIIASEKPAVYLEDAVLKMCESLNHRGPDDSGLFAIDGVALGHTRLSIIDIACCFGNRRHHSRTDTTTAWRFGANQQRQRKGIWKICRSFWRVVVF